MLPEGLKLNSQRGSPVIDMDNHLKILKDIFLAGVKSVNPYDILIQNIKIEDNALTIQNSLLPGGGKKERISLEPFYNIIVIGAGKGTAPMAKAIEEIFGERIKKGLISVKYGHTMPLEKIRLVEAGHPVPDQNSVFAAKSIMELAEKADNRTLVINLISGGGSALLTVPFEDKKSDIAITLEEKQKVTKILLECGASIREINTIRKHISGIKGGRLAKILYPATSVNFILSDVVGDDLGSIASGLTFYDSTTFSDVKKIMEKYGITGNMPENIKKLVDLGLRGDIDETPGKGDIIFAKAHNIIIGSNSLSLEAAAEKAGALGFEPLILSSQITGESREIAKFFSAMAKDIVKRGWPMKKPCAIITGGETTVTVKGHGKGGRNQEMALSFLSQIGHDPESFKGVYFLSGATDGNDGPTDAAGAFVSYEIFLDAGKKGFSPEDYLRKNDSYNFFDNLGFLLKIGPTNTNVCDIQVMIVT